MKNVVPSGNPYVGNPHVRFEEEEVSSTKPRRGSLLCRSQRRKKLCAAAAVVCCAGAAGIAFAEDIPFWGGGSSMPTRTPAAVSSSVAAAPLDSRAVQTAESAPVKFFANEQQGLSIVIR